MKFITATVSFVFLSSLSFGQGNALTETVPAKPKMADKGTYQFIVSAHDTTAIFTNDILVLIEALRDPLVVKYYDASPTVRVKIIPLSEIRKRDFRPIPEIVVIKEQENK